MYTSSICIPNLFISFLLDNKNTNSTVSAVTVINLVFINVALFLDMLFYFIILFSIHVPMEFCFNIYSFIVSLSLW